MTALRILLTAMVVAWSATDALALCNPTASSVTQNENQMMGAESCDLSGNLRTTLGTLISGEDQANNLIKTSGGAVRQTTVTMGAAATANGTTAAFAIPTGIKTFYGQVSGTGAVIQTQAIYGDVDSDAANGVLVCTLVLNGTTRDNAYCRTDVPFLYWYVVTTATSGTSATGAVYVHY